MCINARANTNEKRHHEFVGEATWLCAESNVCFLVKHMHWCTVVQTIKQQGHGKSTKNVFIFKTYVGVEVDIINCASVLHIILCSDTDTEIGPWVPDTETWFQLFTFGPCGRGPWRFHGLPEFPVYIWTKVTTVQKQPFLLCLCWI